MIVIITHCIQLIYCHLQSRFMFYLLALPSNTFHRTSNTMPHQYLISIFRVEWLENIFPNCNDPRSSMYQDIQTCNILLYPLGIHQRVEEVILAQNHLYVSKIVQISESLLLIEDITHFLNFVYFVNCRNFNNLPFSVHISRAVLLLFPVE